MLRNLGIAGVFSQMFVQSTQLTVAQQRKYLRSFLFWGHVVQWLQCARRKAAGRPKHPAPPENLQISPCSQREKESTPCPCSACGRRSQPPSASGRPPLAAPCPTPCCSPAAATGCPPPALPPPPWSARRRAAPAASAPPAGRCWRASIRT